MDTAEMNRRRQAATPRGVSVLCDFYADRAENAELWDTDGKRYIDFASGIAVLNTGHRHPRIIDAVKRQLDRFTHTAYQVLPYASYVELAEQINARVPGDFDKKTVFFTTGAEAVENAVKIARAATGRPGVVSFSGAFHGRTLMGMALTGKVVPYKVGFGPFPDGFYHAPFPNAVAGITTDDAIKALQQLFTVSVSPQRVAAIIVEPVQGEGGFNVAPADFMQRLREICDEHGIVMIADEIQTGFGRTGKLFAMEHFGVAADITTMAKSLAGGFPLSGVCGRAALMDAPAPGGLGGTYAGNPLALAAALEVLKIIDDDALLERAQALGDRLKARLEALRTKVSGVADVRGLGAMVAIELNTPQGAPDPDRVARILALARARGLLLLSCGTHANVIRFLFPLTLPDALMDEALDILAEVLVL